ncbi:MAG: phosphatase PAP2 family protein [Sphingobacteriales bacterium]|nr:MAG: phosphatase PAP2 family protein [Sphingobacteriales bacterium]
MVRNYVLPIATALALLTGTATQAQDALALAAPTAQVVPEDSGNERFLMPRPQQDVLAARPDYHLSWKVDAPITAAGTAWTLWAFTHVYDKDTSTLAEIQALKKEDVNSFDRWAAGKDSEAADANSNYLFYGLIPAPLVLAGLDPAIRKDFWKVGALYLETMAITGTLYTGATFFVDRYRPETYNFDKPASERVDGNYKNAFFAGHVANVGAISFFTAKIFHDYHPNSPWRWAFWGGAALATGATAYMRHEAGKHWPTDLALGTAVGVAAGILVPQLHKKLRADGTGLRISPYIGQGTGMSIAYRF